MILNRSLIIVPAAFIFLMMFTLSYASTETDTMYSQPERIVNEMQRHLVLDNYENWAPGLDWAALRTFYSKRDFYPVWLNYEGATEKSRLFRDILINSDKDGLDPIEYHVPALQYLWRAKKARSKARLELLLTDAFLRYSLEVSVGYRNPRAVDIDWYVRQKTVDVIDLLESALTANNIEVILSDFPPQHPAYHKLKEKLIFYRQIAQQENWQKVDYAPHLKVGMRHHIIPQIRKRLQQENYLDDSQSDDPELFDDELNLAIRKFQYYYGHKVDGVVGYFTRRSLNISIQDQILRIKQNMERWRWMPKDLGRRYIMVNMAGYSLDLVEDGKLVMNMPVIIGKTFRATPAFIDSLEYFVLNPTWKVPPRIAKEKFLPKIRENLNFLKRNRLKVFDSWRNDANEVDPQTVDWDEVSDKRFPYKLEQMPGMNNSMGRIKFMFPNKFRVYLHDTPDKTLFARHIRTFSSGCIRLAEPFKLADKIISWDKNKKVVNVQKQISEGKTIRIDLEHKLPVYLMYWTVWVDNDDHIHFRNDVYQRNEKIATSKEVGFREI